ERCFHRTYFGHGLIGIKRSDLLSDLRHYRRRLSLGEHDHLACASGKGERNVELGGILAAALPAPIERVSHHADDLERVLRRIERRRLKIRNADDAAERIAVAQVPSNESL